ncbi:phenylacetate--CoA ligase family protein [Antrihabitans spumae]|uniref:Phenylacetate--CoA ligase family protein n=1 Tax=Antrihabitans spumae TaxID=3373370 RepID=A0ABW7KAV3_9NOCA
MSAPVSRLDAVVPGFTRALRIFHSAAAQVPAYREFLGEHGVDPATIRTPGQFATVPPVTKENYLRRYPRASLFPNGDITRAGIWSTSSGSSGKPTYWPRNDLAAEHAAVLYDRVFRSSFASHEAPTLLVVGFAMGNWIGGTYTLGAGLELARRGHRLSVIAPGINVDTILNNIADLGGNYERIVLAGYPPFLKDVLDAAGPDVLGHDLRLLMAGENITETWRDHVLGRTGGRAEHTSLIYGTADAGIMGHETPTTIAIRRAARDDEGLGTALFGNCTVAPTFVEYDPRLRYTEVDDKGRLLFTIDNAIPLVRYRINDEGSVHSAADVARILGESEHELAISTAADHGGFIALRRRSDVATSFYAINLYPDSIRPVLERNDIADRVSGKFTLHKEESLELGPQLVLEVELARNRCGDSALEALLRAEVIAALTRTSTEYRELLATKGAAANPMIRLHVFGSEVFQYDVKVSWAQS